MGGKETYSLEGLSAHQGRGLGVHENSSIFETVTIDNRIR